MVIPSCSWNRFTSSSVSLNWWELVATEGPGVSGMGGVLEEEDKGWGVSPW